ncbi:MAG: hypothetical protein M3O26_20295 [Pseudomonadota bacterium]|nr:hypothetical protein [Pseudomonadota bacterium]
MNITVCMGGVVAAGFILCGCAMNTFNSKQPASAAVVSDPNCLTETGSRISAGKSNCRGFGRSYSNDDISRTGQTSAADALGLLDPSITVHR